MYRWILFVHVASVIGFLSVHSASAVAAWRLRQERQLEPARTLLEMTTVVSNLMYGLLTLALLTGVVLGFMGGWWRFGWIWAALGVLLVLFAAMGFLGVWYHRARRFAGVGYFSYQKMRVLPAEPEANPAELGRALASANPSVLIGIGVVGVLILLWLMLFKPF